MRSRVLPIVNAIGCLALTGVVFAQWHKERAADARIDQLRVALADSNTRLAAETKRSTAFQKDIATLKESLELMQGNAEAASHQLSEKDTRVAAMETELTAAREQIKDWENAIQLRDGKLRDLHAEIAATRTRLSEAVEKLKAAGSR